MSGGLIATLIALALVDSTSIGTLFIPIWILLRRGGVAVNRFLIYLGAIAGFYFVVGVAIVLGAGAIAEPLGDALDSDVALWIQLAVGVALFAWSFRFDSKRRGADDRAGRWRDRLDRALDSPPALMGLALLAGVLELATMLPYLAAIGMLTTSGVDWPLLAVVLGGYVVVMILPALVLLGIRVAAERRIRPLLERLSNWMAKHATNTTGWVLGIAGFLIARDAIARLALL